MVNIGYPQKSSFGVLTATEVRTSLINSIGADLHLQKDSLERLTLTGPQLKLGCDMLLGANRKIVDVGSLSVLDPDDAGNIDGLAPITDPAGVRAALIDSVAGDLTFKRAGGAHVVLQADYLMSNKHVRLAGGKTLMDTGANVILDPDDAGAIAALARLDGALTNPAGSQEITLYPQCLVGESQSGTLGESTGTWTTDANDTLYLFLDTILHTLMLLGSVYLESITIYINTTDNADYVNSLTLRWYSAITGANTDDVEELDDIGNGSSGDENGVLTVDSAIVADHCYRFDIACVVPTATLTVRAIKLKYRLT